MDEQAAGSFDPHPGHILLRRIPLCFPEVSVKTRYGQMCGCSKGRVLQGIPGKLMDHIKSPLNARVTGSGLPILCRYQAKNLRHHLGDPEP